MKLNIKVNLLSIIAVVVIFILGATAGWFYNEIKYSKLKLGSDAYAKGELYGLREGFDKGFISGNHFTTGQYIAIRNGTMPEKYFDWYTMEGYRSTTIKNYTRPSMNPYLPNVINNIKRVRYDECPSTCIWWDGATVNDDNKMQVNSIIEKVLESSKFWPETLQRGGCIKSIQYINEVYECDVGSGDVLMIYQDINDRQVKYYIRAK